MRGAMLSLQRRGWCGVVSWESSRWGQWGLCGGGRSKTTHLVTVHDGRRPSAEDPKASQHTEHLPPGRALPRHTSIEVLSAVVA